LLRGHGALYTRGMSEMSHCEPGLAAAVAPIRQSRLMPNTPTIGRLAALEPATLAFAHVLPSDGASRAALPDLAGFFDAPPASASS